MLPDQLWLRVLRGLTPYDHVRQIWTKEARAPQDVPVVRSKDGSARLRSPAGLSPFWMKSKPALEPV